MVVDTSALLAILEDESTAQRLVDALSAADAIRVSAGTALEAGIVVEARRGEAGGRELDLLLHRLRADVVSVTAEHVEIARDAYRRYGKGHHPAALNFGDCFAYALASALGEPLMFVGNDFARTDVEAAAY
ncbi:MAG TPA: type II toxin-antitoxin system VapC family toxin [Gemmatimonadaceae bacterium]|nr:type II toxin-antitoxin system VapC family toxin [Gemmatimonadaceae bacterium]